MGGPSKPDENELQIHMADGETSFENSEKKNCCTRFISPNVKRELCEIYRLAWPTIFISFFEATLSTQSIVFFGQIGKTELATGTLAISFLNIFGLSIATGMCSALDTLCSQAYGASNFKMVGIVLQRGVCILGIAMILVGAFWMMTGHFLLAIGIEEEIARMVDQFMIFLLPILLPLFGSQLLIRYLIAQGIVRPSLWIGFICNVIAISLNFLFVILLKRGFWGVGISLVIAMYCNLFLNLAYIIFSKVYQKTWTGWSFECFYNWKQFIWLSVPGMLMICLEWWSFEIGSFLMGRFGESTLGAHGVLMQLVTLTFMIPYGISTAAAVRVGQNLGASKPSLAKLVMKLAIGLTFLCVSLTVLICVTTRNYIAMAFSNSGEVIGILIKTIPLMAVLSFFDATQGVCSGIVRGCGQQRIGVIVNFISYDIIGIPLGVVLAFVLDLRLAGMWWGLTSGLFVQSLLYITLLCCTNWQKQAELAQKRTRTSHSSPVVHLSTNDKDHLISTANAHLNQENRNDDYECMLKSTTADHSPTFVWSVRVSSLHDLDRITMVKTSENTLQNITSLDQNKTKQVHVDGRKRVIFIRLIPLVLVLLVLCGTVCVRFLVPLPAATNYHHYSSNSTTLGNQTTSVSGTSLAAL